jgi:hypothetical protein
MQPRRTGLLLALAQALLTLVVGCSQQTTALDLDSDHNSTGAESSESLIEGTAGTTAGLQHVDIVPQLQQTPAAPSPSSTSSEIVQTRYRPPGTELSSGQDASLPRQPQFSRAPDYTWLEGELLFSSVRGVWRLRYAAPEDEDPYGGSVTLVDLDSKLGFQSGQHVRVKGRLINPRTSEPSPYYHVTQVERK